MTTTFHQQNNANFWAHYNAAQAWLRFHHVAAQKAYEKTKRLYSGISVQSTTPRYGQNHQKKKNISKRRFTEGELSADAEQARCSTIYNHNDNMVINSTEEDLEMDAEMVAFFKETLEHRKKRDAKRLKEGGKDDSVYWAEKEIDEYVLADEIGVHGITRPSTRTPNVAAEFEKKKKEMRELYGEDAEKIAAMETALDMHFEQYLSNHEPPLWPSIPLKF